MQQRQQLHEQNLQMQHKLSDYFRKKKSEDMRQEVDKNVADQEQRYLKYMGMLSFFIIFIIIISNKLHITHCWCNFESMT